MEKNKELLNRLKGILLGGAVGDAFGMPTEFLTNEQIKKLFRSGITNFQPSTNFDFLGREMKAGEVTDDTINTILITEMLIEEKGKIDADKYITKLIEWTNHSEIAQFVSGPSTLKALTLIQEGTSINEAGKFGTTNGASMKIAPIGIISDFNDMDTLIDNVYQICLPTHNTSIAVSGACAIAACISYAVSGGTDIEELWLVAEKAISMCTKGIDTPSPSLTVRLKYAKKIAEENTLEEAMEKIYTILGTGVETIETIPAVLAVIQMAQGDPMKAAKISAVIGGDTDTIGAISTAICGGMNPIFSPETTDFIEKTNKLDFEKLAIDLLPYAYNYKK